MKLDLDHNLLQKPGPNFSLITNRTRIQNSALTPWAVTLTLTYLVWQRPLTHPVAAARRGELKASFEAFQDKFTLDFDSSQGPT